MRRTKEEAEQTREDILNAAVRIFSQKGVGQTSLDEIAKAANVTRGAVYWHFKNKVEIFDALFENLHRPVLDMIMDDLEKDHPEPLKQLRDLCVGLLVSLEKDEYKRQALILFFRKCNYAGDLEIYKEKHDRKKMEKQKAFTRYFDKAKAKGKLPADADCDLLTQAVGCYMKGILFEYLDNPEELDIREKAPMLIDLFFEKFM